MRDFRFSPEEREEDFEPVARAASTSNLRRLALTMANWECRTGIKNKPAPRPTPTPTPKLRRSTRIKEAPAILKKKQEAAKVARAEAAQPAPKKKTGKKVTKGSKPQHLPNTRVTCVRRLY
ncbi:unnamed protein product [Zymoseptoria tritici ST99CH_3D7]|uniref:Uncharacterized protein n=1 Tax=Zymoseptoria tritici (strain ST99CH_3D7) TaxID=1276538 RepID=A0A1X7S5C2_ZYMT9|nr:unnamed protein product [Zymoseptoria tritici ST99CH_3D7]